MTKHKFLEWDEESDHINEYLQNQIESFGPLEGEPTYEEVAKFQHSLDVEIMKELLGIIEMQQEALSKYELVIYEYNSKLTPDEAFAARKAIRETKSRLEKIGEKK